MVGLYQPHHLVERRGGDAVLDFLDVDVRKPGCCARVPQGHVAQLALFLEICASVSQ